MALCLALLCGGCNPFHRRPKKVFTPPPSTQPVPRPVPTTEPPPEPPPVQAEPPTAPQIPLPAPPDRPRPERPRPARPAPPRPEPAGPIGPQQPPQAQQPAAPERVGPLLSDADQRTYNSAINAALATAERNLAEADRRRGNMNRRQRALLAQAQSYVDQAKELRASDLMAARSLADRAALVSRELLSSLR